jgi:hypothetical protein
MTLSAHITAHHDDGVSVDNLRFKLGARFLSVVTHWRLGTLVSVHFDMSSKQVLDIERLENGN